MMRSVYDTATGLFTGAQCTRGVELPAGLAAIEGQFDRLTQRVDTATGQVVSYQPPPPALADAKAAARARMMAAWSTARSAGVPIGGKTAPTDAESWTRYLVIKEMAADAGWVDVPIPLADGTFELLTQAKAAALWTAIKSLERTLLATLRDRIQAINAAADVATVQAVQWPG